MTPFPCIISKIKKNTDNKVSPYDFVFRPEAVERAR